jgi:FkbM family methyltransferase
MSQSRLVQALKSVRYAPQVANWAAIGAAAWQGHEVTSLHLRNGVVLNGAPRSRMMMLYKEIWYRDVYQLRSEPMPPDATVIDIGANIGVFALYAATLGRAARVLCYEPFPDSCDALRQNAARNHLPALQAFQMAVTGRSGQRQLQVGDCDGWNTMFGTASQQSMMVECTTLGEILEQQRIARCDFLKVDCEGAEFEILLETSRPALAHVARIALEYHDNLTPHRHAELVDYLRAAGFVVRLDGDPHEPTGYLFAHRST